MDTFYFGARPKHYVTRTLGKAGHRIVHARYRKGILASLSTCAAVVLYWKSQRDQEIIEEAKAASLPVMVITANLVDAYTAGDPLADLYLEEPASDEDVAALLIDMIDMEKNAGAAAGSGTNLAA